MRIRTWRKQARLTLKELRERIPKPNRPSLATLSRLDRGEVKRPNPKHVQGIVAVSRGAVTVAECYGLAPSRSATGRQGASRQSGKANP